MSNHPQGHVRGGNRGGYSGAPRGGGGGMGARGGHGGGFRGGAPGDLIFRGPTSVDQRLATSDQLVSSFKNLPFKPERPHRPGYGTLGREITLRANFFAVRLPKEAIYDYHVEITPTTDIKRIRARLFSLLEKSSQPGWGELVPFIAHDRSERLVSSKKLPQPLDVQVRFYDEGEAGPNATSKTYTFAITFTAKLDIAQLRKFLDGNIQSRDFDTQPLVSAVNLVLQTHATRTGVRVGQNRYFFPSKERLDLSPGVEAWKGFFMSARPVYKELMVNIGVCMTAFYKPGNLADAIMKFDRTSDGAMLHRFAQKLKVTTNHLGYKQKKPVKKILSTTARQTFFNCEEFGGKTSVEEYFKKKYQIRLRHPNDLPVVDISGPNSKFTIYVPAELCEIEPGQPFRGRLNEKETSNMIRYACNPPKANAEAIIDPGLPTLGLTPKTSGSTLYNFGMTVDSDMASISGRELPAPHLSYRAGRANVDNGSWNIVNVKFHSGGVIKSWWVLVIKDGPAVFSAPDDPKLVGIWKGFGEKCRDSGMSLGSTPIVVSQGLPPPAGDPARQQALDSIRQNIKKRISEKGKPTFILVILSHRDNYIYPGVKRICDVELGVHTIHMLTDKVLCDPKKQDQYFSNVALKLNTKLGGINHKLDQESLKWLLKGKTMIVGMDVTHPGPGSIEGTPSIAAVVASVDDTFVQFPASLRCQETKKEMITDLTSMMIERLQVYSKKNQVLPDKVIIYRDGVSEGQFDTVLEEELPKVLEAFKRVPPGAGPKNKPYRPTLSIIICGKRHHAKFWPTDSQFVSRNGNTRPGTVVDKGVTAVFDFDFYLQAHAGLQGHAKPTHYTVVYDENRFGADEVQQGTHTVSYLYARATKAVSLVPAAYYADLACERGRCYLNDFLSVDDKTSTSGVSGKGKGKAKADKEEEKKRVYESALKAWGQGVHPDLRGSMFYI